MALNARQLRFVEEYLIDLNATQAAIRAGYSKATARNTASENMAKPGIQAQIARRQAELAAMKEITPEKVIAELAKIGFANMQDYMGATSDGDPFLDFSALTREQTAAMSEVTVEDYTEGRGEDARNVKRVKFKLWDKRAALNDIGKHLGMFIDRKQTLGADGKPIDPIATVIQVYIPDNGRGDK